MRQRLSIAIALWAATAAGADPVAVVSTLQGSATAVAPGGSPTPIRVFDWIEPGTTLSVAAHSTVTVAFETGDRWEIGSGARATLRSDGLADTSGPIQKLASVPRLPRVAAALGGDGGRAGAVRIRAGQVVLRHPRGATTLADRTVLRFDPVVGARGYRVDVEAAGDTVFRVETVETAVAVPAGVLRPDTDYVWTVRTAGAGGYSVRAEGDFHTLDEESARARRELEGAVQSAGDRSSRLLLAGLDRRLGLWWEAREELAQVLADPPADPQLQAVLAELDAHLDGQP